MIYLLLFAPLPLLLLPRTTLTTDESSQLDIGARLPMQPGMPEDNVHLKYMEFLDYVVGKVKHLRIGELLLMPGGWRTSDVSGHAVMYALIRKSVSSVDHPRGVALRQCCALFRHELFGVEKRPPI